MSYNSPFTGNVIQPTDVSYRAVTLSANTQLQWPINGNATDDYAARIMQVTATTAGLSLYIPPANHSSVRNDAMISNVRSNLVTAKPLERTNTNNYVSSRTSTSDYHSPNHQPHQTQRTSGRGKSCQSGEIAS